MKKLFNIYMLLLVFYLPIIGFSQTQITLIFVGRDAVTQNLIPIDSVNINNLSEGCDTLLSGPIPVFSFVALWPVGIGEINDNRAEAFILKQNYPNPFQGSTVVNLYREYSGTLNLMLFDALGTKLAEYQNEFEKGFLSFVISSSGNKVLILSVFDDKNNRSIKIISAGQGNESNSIQYLGQTQNIGNNSLKNVNNSGFIYYLGNQMMYTAHSTGYNEKILIDSPETDSTYYFDMTMFYLPSVTTNAVTNITQTTATSGGNVTSEGGATVTARGVCWSTSSNPTIANSHTTDGSGTGTFISYLTGLTPNTPYYVRAYATNNVGSGYGNEVSFTTGQTITPPVVTTALVTNITQTTAISGGTVVSDGGATVTARGVCWSTTPNPTTAGSYTIDGTGTGTFVSYITGLTGSTQYYIRAYATNSAGTSYGNELSFTTLTLPIVSTAAVTNIAQTTATSGGTVSSDGGATVTARGVCWSASSNPTLANSYTIDGTGTGTFISNLTGLSGGTQYYVRAYATNSVGTSYGNDLSFTTINLPTVTTSEVTNLSETIATSGGTISTDGGATVTTRGVCWSQSPNPTTANSHTADGSGTGTFISNINGLAGSTLYYVRAYAINSVGIAYGNEIAFTSFPVFSCGSSITINHTSGSVSPVNKTVTYNTVTNIPGETSKCWITSNLGADHQAISKDDATEASAGWYWQFNRKQGYKHDGTVRTPNTNWILYIGENCDWLLANDPCALELQNEWRVPTYTEWNNVFINGAWTNWNGPWNSGLKLHAAGLLSQSNNNAELVYRGINGFYWSSTQYSEISSWSLFFGSTGSWISEGGKKPGNTLRCIKNASSASALPDVTTSPVTNITLTFAISGGNVYSNGPVFASGVCWSTNPNPTTIDNHSSDGTGIGEFVSNLTGLTPNTMYYIRAYATNSVGTDYGNEISFTTLLNPILPIVTTTNVSNIQQNAANSGGVISSDGGSAVITRGVCWSASPIPSITGNHTSDGSGSGTYISYLSNLSAGTLYYVRAYATNIIGTSYGNELWFIAVSCGSSITINHTSGTVSPVNKTVTYNTVTNVPGETSKCWITSNLGADHQAISKDDATEASAGWYWQFNRKQGYKHDGIVRTPNTQWIYPIFENFDWQSVNDPCNLLLGDGWRIPSSTEWFNVKETGGWYDWNGPWNSSLKLHAAGSLNDVLVDRGVFGSYWSKTQYSMGSSAILTIMSFNVGLSSSSKHGGATIRCIRE